MGFLGLEGRGGAGVEGDSSWGEEDEERRR